MKYNRNLASPISEDSVKSGGITQTLPDAQDLQTFLSAAEKAYVTGDFPSVCRAFEDALRIAPNNRELLEGLGNVQFQMGLFPAALDSFSQAAKIEPRNAELLARLGIAAANCGNFPLFESTFERVFKLDPENVSAHRFLAHLHLAQQNYAEGVAHFCRVIQREPNDLESLVNAGLCYRKLDKSSVARYMFEEALRVDPNNVVAKQNLNEMRVLQASIEAEEILQLKPARPPQRNRGTLESLIADIRNDKIGRPHYAHGLLLATLQAMKIGVKEMSVYEFGVLRGDGLLNLCAITERITQDTGFKFKIYGFDSDVGMPPITDYRDHPEIWYTGQFKVDHDLLRKKLPANAELIVGEIGKTILPFCKTHLSPECPVGFVAIDVDLYSSTVSSFKLFKQGKADCYLPAVVMYFDDVNDMITLNSWCGEALAVKEFNRANKFRKIEEKWTRQNSPNAGWHDQMYCCHILDHPVRSGKLKCASLDLNVTIY